MTKLIRDMAVVKKEAHGDDTDNAAAAKKDENTFQLDCVICVIRDKSGGEYDYVKLSKFETNWTGQATVFGKRFDTTDLKHHIMGLEVYGQQWDERWDDWVPIPINIYYVASKDHVGVIHYRKMTEPHHWVAAIEQMLYHLKNGSGKSPPEIHFYVAKHDS